MAALAGQQPVNRSKGLGLTCQDEDAAGVSSFAVPVLAGVAQRVRAEPDQPRWSWAGLPAGGHLQVQEVGQPVADRAPADPPSALVAEQRRALAQPRGDLRQVPPQNQVQAVEHRDPPGPRARGLGSLAEVDVDLAERSAPEVHVSPIEGRTLPGPQPRQVERAEQGVVGGPRPRTCAHRRHVP